VSYPIFKKNIAHAEFYCILNSSQVLTVRTGGHTELFAIGLTEHISVVENTLVFEDCSPHEFESNLRVVIAKLKDLTNQLKIIGEDYEETS